MKPGTRFMVLGLLSLTVLWIVNSSGCDSQTSSQTSGGVPHRSARKFGGTPLTITKQQSQWITVNRGGRRQYEFLVGAVEPDVALICLVRGTKNGKSITLPPTLVRERNQWKEGEAMPYFEDIEDLEFSLVLPGNSKWSQADVSYSIRPIR